MSLRSSQCLIITAPSGAGKSTLIKALMEKYPALFQFSISATTRPPRQGEVDGRHYHFLSSEAFKAAQTDNAFLEWEEVYTGLFYGTLRSEVSRIQNNGAIPLFDIDVNGGLSLQQKIDPKPLSIFIKPPSKAVLEQRLIDRKTESADTLRDRLARYDYEIRQEASFDYAIVNDDLDQASQELFAIIDKHFAP
ncbi:MAG: guanylate kinase [Chitinophagales bacterium]